ncbi:L,D-transpeptidase [Rurimicrobium arvi]
MKYIHQLNCLIVLSIAAYGCDNANKQPVPAPAAGTAKQMETVSGKAAKPEEPALAEVHYHFEYKKVWSAGDSFSGNAHKDILCYLNRVDEKHLKRLDSFIVPDLYDRKPEDYMPFPAYSESLKDIRKVIIFSYPTQAFAAYEQGKRIISGPTNMGKKASRTPTGLFFCNWKSKETKSTVNEEWILKWNFNVSNMGGVGFHQYDLPGYPASHSCMRLLEEQARFLYGWADQWKLSASDQLLEKGTPVIIYGAYPFGQPRPWFALTGNAHALDISEEQLNELVKPYLEEIMAAQQARGASEANASSVTNTQTVL